MRPHIFMLLSTLFLNFLKKQTQLFFELSLFLNLMVLSFGMLFLFGFVSDSELERRFRRGQGARLRPVGDARKSGSPKSKAF